MNDDLFPEDEPLDPAVAERIAAQLAASSKPVRPLPSNAVLTGIGLTIFAGVAAVVAWAVGFKAIAALDSGEMAAYYGVIAVLAILFARAVIERMIPGEIRIIRAWTLAIGGVSILAILMAGLFVDHGTDHFVARGIPCLRLGVITGLISGAIGWRFLQRGFLASPYETLTLYGFFAGLTGVATLALHCPIRNSLHFLVWHLGAMVLAGLAGMLLGRFADRRSYAN
jgi:hypothetical protein